MARAVSLKESHLVKVILMRREPSVEVYEMMSSDVSERVGSFNSDCTFDWRFVEARTAGATFSSVSLALDDVSCH